MTDEEMKRVSIWLNPRDLEIINELQSKYGCNLASAVRACIRIASDITLKLDRPLHK